MDPYLLLVVVSTTQTRLMLTHGPQELLRAVLPPLTHIPNAQAVVTLVQGLALWVDRPLSVVLCANASGTTYWLGLTDARGCGARSLFYEVQLVQPTDKRNAGRVHAFGGEWEDLQQLNLWQAEGEQP